MKRLFFVVVTLAVLYGGYWFVGSRTVETQATAALDGLRDEGWQVSYTSLNTSGFPSRFDTTLSDPDLTAPEGWRYTAPFLQIFALSYRPNEVIVIFPPEQTVTVDGQSVTLASDRLRASASVTASTDVAFRAATLEGGATSVTFADGQAITLDSLLAALRRAARGDAVYDAFVDLRGIGLPAPEGALPGPMDRVMLDAQVSLDAPLDRVGLSAETPPEVTGIAIKDALMLWDDMQIRAEGTLEVDAEGYPAGQIDVRVRGWDEILTTAAAAGFIDPAVVPTYRDMADRLAQGDAELTLPLTFADGAIRMGFVPLGAAPRLR